MERERAAGILVLLFVVTNVLGLAAAMNLQDVDAVREASERNQDVQSGLYFFLLIGIATAIMLLLFKYNAYLLVRIWFGVALFMTSLIFFGAFFDAVISFLIAGAFMLSRYGTRKILVRNVHDVVPFAGAGALFGSIIGFQAALALLLLLSLYDYFSVNISKHMISLAEESMGSDTFMGFAYPRGEEPLEEAEVGQMELSREEMEDMEEGRRKVGILGGGDVVIPMIFAISLLSDFGTGASLSSIVGSSVALWVLLVKSQEGKFYPAIPTVAGGALLGFLLWLGLNSLFL